MQIHSSAYQAIITFGKYRGRSLGFIAETNPEYLEWISGTETMPMTWRTRAARTLLGEVVDGPPQSTLSRLKPVPPSIIEAGRGYLALTFPYNKELVDRLKIAVDGAHWDPVKKHWKIFTTQILYLIEFFGGLDKVNIDDACKSLYFKEIARREELEYIRTAKEFKFDIPGLKLPLKPKQTVALKFAEALNWRSYCAYDCGEGKAQPLDTPILTPTGFTEMRRIKVGDAVIGSNGRATTVIGVYPQGVKPVYRVTFQDGTSTECCDEHLWAVQDTNHRTRKTGYTIRPLREIRQKLETKGRRHHFIPMVAPIEFEEQNFLPIDPYFLGVLLGDGCLTGGTVSVSSADEEILDTIRSLLPDSLSLKHKGKYDYGITKVIRSAADNPILTALRKLGLMKQDSHTKFIPKEYLFASLEHRIALLQGLLDTDGWTNPKRSMVGFATVSGRLATDFQFLVESLGGLAPWTTKHNRFGEVYCFTIALPPEIAPFKLNRKTNNYIARTKYPPARAIVSVDYVEDKETRCIKVEAADGLYVTDHCIVTHNTAIAIAQGLYRGAKTLVACEKNVLTQWAIEIKRFTGKSACVWSTDGIDGKNSAQFHVANYDVIPKYREKLYKLGFQFLVCDEATQLKNYKTIRSMTLLGSNWKKRKEYPGFNCPELLFLSATPMPNRPIELFSILHKIDSKRFVNPAAYVQRYGGGRKHEEYQNIDELHERTKDIIIRSKADLETGFSRHDLYVDLTNAEKTELERETLDLIRELRLTGNPSASQMPAFRKLLFKYKYPRLIAFIDEMQLSNKPVLAYFLHQAEAEQVANHYGKKAVVIHGGHSTAERDIAKAKLKSGEATIGCLTLIAGAKGMDGLQEVISDTITTAVWFVPYLHEQAEKRVFRIGQTRHVHSWWLKVPNSIDETMTDVLKDKLEVIGQTLDGVSADLIRNKNIFKEVLKKFAQQRKLNADFDGTNDIITLEE
jgi:hypothetical protein